MQNALPTLLGLASQALDSKLFPSTAPPNTPANPPANDLKVSDPIFQLPGVPDNVSPLPPSPPALVRTSGFYNCPCRPCYCSTCCDFFSAVLFHDKALHSALLATALHRANPITAILSLSPREMNEAQFQRIREYHNSVKNDAFFVSCHEKFSQIFEY